MVTNVNFVMFLMKLLKIWTTRKNVLLCMRVVSLNEKTEEFNFENLLEQAASEPLETLFLLPEGDFGNTYFHKGRQDSKKLAESVG